jgi:hypothetical protein
LHSSDAGKKNGSTMRQYIKTFDLVRREVLYNILIEFGVPMKLVRLIKMFLNEMDTKVHVGKRLCYNFPIQNGLKRDALFPLLFNFALKYAIRKIQENLVGLKLNGTHHVLVYVYNVNLLRGDIDTIKKNAETIIDTSKGVDLEVNAKKTIRGVLPK